MASKIKSAEDFELTNSLLEKNKATEKKKVRKKNLGNNICSLNCSRELTACCIWLADKTRGNVLVVSGPSLQPLEQTEGSEKINLAETYP